MSPVHQHFCLAQARLLGTAMLRKLVRVTHLGDLGQTRYLNTDIDLVKSVC